MSVDLSVVITSIGRKSLSRAVGSIFRQNFPGKIQILIGVDKDIFGQTDELFKQLSEICPPNITITWLRLDYSTSVRYGGVHSSQYGGSLRTALTFLADSKYVMYLDDDDWLAENHCSTTLEAIQGKYWAFALSNYADGNTEEVLCIDEMESVGVDNGIYKERFGGFVRPSGLLINKLELMHILHLWSHSPFETGDGEDRLIFDQLRNVPGGFTGLATVYCSIDPKDSMHQIRTNYIKTKGTNNTSEYKMESIR